MSTDSQVSSPDRQRAGFATYCQTHGLTPAGEYADEGVSATHTRMEDRPALMQMLADARRRRFDVVWAEEVSRIARRESEWFAIRDALSELGIAIVGPGDDPHSAHDDIMRQFSQGLFALLARFEARQLGQRMRRAQQVKVAQGRYRGGRLPPGLAWGREEGRYTLDEATAPVARRAFDLYPQLLSFEGVARTLNAEGYLTTAGRQFSGEAVRDILSCSAYRGSRDFGGEEYPTDLPAIVDAAAVAAVDELLARRRGRPRGAVSPAVHASFAGLLRCPECSGWLTLHVTYRTRASGERVAHARYMCYRARQAPHSCTWRGCVAQSRLEAAILPQVAARAREMARAARPRRESTRRATGSQRLLQALDDERQRAIALRVRGTIGDEELDRLLAQVEARRGELQVARPEPRVTREEARAVLAAVEKHWGQMDAPTKRGILQAMIEHIVPAAPLTNSAIAWRW
jgi:DNA invertase Pin-like site-specific DNA recombinase